MIIVAPVHRSEDVAALHTAGARELYCGILPRTWVDLYGPSDRLNKRQGLVANVPSFGELFAILENAHRLGMPVALTLNTAYSADMLPAVLEIAAQWAKAGGDAIMVSDPALVMALAQRRPEVKRCLSILANPFNSGVIQFYNRFGIKRVVLPRELSLIEMGALTGSCPGMEFEVMAFNDKCPLIDGLCGFYHATVFNPVTPAACQVQRLGRQAVVYANDPGYAGHGCSLLFGKQSNPGCAACSLADLEAAGIGFLKLGGRGLPVDVNARNVAFVRSIMELFHDESQAGPETIKAHFAATFGRECRPEMCYYAA